MKWNTKTRQAEARVFRGNRIRCRRKRGNIMDYKARYEQWCTDSIFDEETKAELLAIAGDEKEIEDRFYKDLSFGTGGLRGVIGAGTNRMNIYLFLIHI